jgi:hypothetical protein
MLINVGHSGGNFMFDNRHRYTLRGSREKRNFIELIKKKRNQKRETKPHQKKVLHVCHYYII